MKAGTAIAEAAGTGDFPMIEGQPSRTALAAAAHRAAHQLLDAGRIFHDPFASCLLGPEASVVIDRISADPAQRPLRTFIAARSRFAEDCLARAVARGVRQAVVVGAGLDTLSLRNPHAAAGLRVFEVDHPATQQWKRQRMHEAGLAAPATLVFAPLDFERQSLAEGLAIAGFDPDQPAFFVWLGVVPYLRSDAIRLILRFIAGLPASEVVFDYAEPLENFAPDRRAHAAAIAERAAAIGEPWRSYFDPAQLAAELRGLGFAELDDVDRVEIAVRYFGEQRTGLAGEAGPHVISARRRN